MPLYHGPRIVPLARAQYFKEDIMGLLEEAVGAVAAVEGAKKLDPNASLITEGIAAVAGLEGTKAITEHLEEKKEEEQAGQS
jgi:hypothetical protein